jgi:uncharacterized protein (TIGR00369 family)
MDSTFDPVSFDKMMKSFGHNGWLGHRYHAHGPDWIELAMDWREDLVGDVTSGALASGPIIALMDNAAGASVWLKRKVFGPQVTIDLRVDYMRPAVTGATVIARCECYKQTSEIGFIRGIAYDATPDDPLCHVVGTFMLLKKLGA